MKPFLLLACVPALLTVIPAMAAGGRPAEAYAARVLPGLQQLTGLLPEYTGAANVLAQHMVQGGTLWLAGDKGFVLEGLNRAGGLMACKWLTKPEEAKRGDIVLLGSLGELPAADRQLIAQVAGAGAHVLVLGPVFPEGELEADYLAAPYEVDPSQLPVASPLLAASLWTLTAETIGALTRLGKMPPMYQSVLVPGGRERNAEHLKLQWEPTAPAPIAPGELGRTYLARVANWTRTLQATQVGKIAQAGQLAAEAIRAGHTAWYASLGHLPPELPGQPGDPGVLKPLKYSTPEKIGEQVKPGDVILYVGYYEPYGGPWVEIAHGLGAKIVTVMSGTPERAAEDMGADINISGCWPFGDTTLEIPGYDVKVLPPSGVIQSAVYYMLVAETMAAGK